MDSILNNSAALSALQALQMTQQSLNTVQNQVSTGLSVSSAADNSSYWSIAAELNADSSVVQASNDALSQGQSVLATASSAINSVITTINSIATALTQATEPGAEIGNINTSLASLGQQLTDAVNGASFNGMNVLNGSLTALNFVSGFNATATGGTVNTIAFTAQALYGLTTGGTSTPSPIRRPWASCRPSSRPTRRTRLPSPPER
jgi:flagellin